MKIKQHVGPSPLSPRWSWLFSTVTRFLLFDCFSLCYRSVCTLHYKSTVRCDLVLYISLNWKNEHKYITGKHVVCLGEKKNDFFKSCFHDFIQWSHFWHCVHGFSSAGILYSVVASGWVLHKRLFVFYFLLTQQDSSRMRQRQHKLWNSIWKRRMAGMCAACKELLCEKL